MTDTGYSADHAAYYDAVAGGDRGDIAFYRERALAADGPVLELACGTGRVTLPLCRAGVDVDGIDLSADALAVLREKAADEGVDPAVWRANMTEFAVDRQYALVICPFNAFQHLLTVEDQLDALERVHNALAPDGAFVFDVFVPSFDVICERYGAWQTREREYRGETHEVRTRSRLVDEVEQHFAVETEVSAPDGEQVVGDEFRLKLLPKREIELLARLSPFDEWAVAGGFEKETIEDGDATQVWTLQK
jgi:SAM-dependent methyltransferase